MSYKTKENGSRQGKDYSKYQMSNKEIVKYSIQFFFIIGILAYIFYQSFIAIAFLSPLLLLLFKEKKAKLCKKQKEILQMQFKDAVLAVAAALEAGYSPENAFKEAYYDMKVLNGSESNICKEFFYIHKQLLNNIPLEQLLLDFGKRSDIEDIKDFAEIFRVAKRSGGDLSKIIKNTATIISDKNEVKKDMETVLSSKKYEQKIMNIIPFFMIIYIGISSPGFFAPLYHNVIGNVIMTICLLLYMGAFMLAEKIINIAV